MSKVSGLGWQVLHRQLKIGSQLLKHKKELRKSGGKIVRLPRELFNAVYDVVPRICVDLIIKDERHRILLSMRSIQPAKGYWHLPGGTILKGETIFDAAKRVALVETGLDLMFIRLLPPIEYITELAVCGHSISIPILARAVGGEWRGSRQAKISRYFKECPIDMIPEQANFLNQHIFIKEY